MNVEPKELSRPFPVVIRFERGYSKIVYDHVPFKKIEEGLDIRTSNNFKNTAETSKYNREREMKVNLNGILSASGSIPGLESLGGASGSISGGKTDKDSKTTETYYCSNTISVEKARIYLKNKQIEIDPDFEKDIERIIDKNMGDKKKITDSLVKYFNERGYFVPMEIGLGGLAVIKYEVNDQKNVEEASKSFKLGIKLKDGVVDTEDKLEIEKKNEKTNKDTIKNLTIEVQGGSFHDTSSNLEDIDKWSKTLEVKNYEIIAADNQMPISRFFSDKLKDKFEPFSLDVKEEMKKPFEVLNLFLNLPRFESWEGKTIDASVQKVFSTGHTKAIEGVIEEKTVPLHKDKTLLSKKDEVNCYVAEPNQVIVGYLIEGTIGNMNDGTFKIESMSNKGYNIVFTSQRGKEQGWIIHIFYIKV